MVKRGVRRIWAVVSISVIGGVLGTAVTMSAASAGRFAETGEISAPSATASDRATTASPAGAIPSSVNPTSASPGQSAPAASPTTQGTVTAGSSTVVAPSSTAPKGPSIQIGEGVTITNPAKVIGSGAALDRGMQALGQIRFDWQSAYPGWTIAFRPAKDGLLGLTLVTERRVEIFVRQSRPIGGIAHDIAHELGHVTDVVYGSSQTRETYRSIRKLSPSTPWWTCNSCRDMEVGAGDFAETFALIAAPKFRFYSEAGTLPSAQELDEIVQFVLPDGLLDSAPPALALRSKPASKSQSLTSKAPVTTLKVRR